MAPDWDSVGPSPCGEGLFWLGGLEEVQVGVGGGAEAGGVGDGGEDEAVGLVAAGGDADDVDGDAVAAFALTPIWCIGAWLLYADRRLHRANAELPSPQEDAWPPPPNTPAA